MRIKDNEDKKSKIQSDLELIREEKNDLESSLKAANGKIQQNDKGADLIKMIRVVRQGYQERTLISLMNMIEYPIESYIVS